MAKVAKKAAPARTGSHPFARFEWTIAGRYLRSRRREAFISVIASFSFIGIMLGVATLIIVMAVMNGFRTELISKILGLNGHVILQAMDTKLTDYADVTQRVAAVPGVVSAIPLVEGQALASGTNTSSGVLVRGVRQEDLPKIGGIYKNVRLGTLDNFDESGGIAIGTRLATQLGLSIGDNLTLVTPRGSVTPMGVTPRIKAYPVVAIFEIGMSEYDSTFVFMPFSEAQTYFNMSDEASAIEIYLANADMVDALRPAIERAADRQVLITDWQQRNATFFSALEVERNVMFLILTLIVLVAALNIISGLTMLVKDKGHDIAILRTMGATRGAILRVFFITGAAIGTVGTLAGFALGVLVNLNIEFDPPVPLGTDTHRVVLARALFPEPVACRNESARDDLSGPHGVGALLPGDAISGLACGTSRSGRRASLRMNDARPRPAADPEKPVRRPILRLNNVQRYYREGDGRLIVLNGADLQIYPGEMVALVAPSGAGKSTLLHIAGLLEKPNSGEVAIAGRPTGKLSDAERTALRRLYIGFVYQFHHLLPEFTAVENVMMPQLIRGIDRREARKRAMQLLAYMRVKERASHRPGELSGGEQQRVAIARAVANAPRLLLADEPTGNLDPTTADFVFTGLTRLVRASRLAGLIATHNHDLAARMDRCITLVDGKVVELAREGQAAAEEAQPMDRKEAAKAADGAASRALATLDADAAEDPEETREE